MTRNTKQLKRTLAYIVCAVLGLSACSETYNKYDDCPACNYYSVPVGSATTVPVSAIGVELDPHFFSQNLTRNDGSKAEDWDNIIVERIKRMKIQQIRVMMQPQWWEPSNDNADPDVADMSKFTFNSEEMKSVYKVLDLAEEQHIEVTLVVWGCIMRMDLISGINSGQKHFLCDARTDIVNPGWIAGTDKYEEFAENFSTLVKYLIEEKHYTCIKQITPFNEPDSHIAGYGRLMWQGDLETMGQADTYAPMAKVLDAKFKADGIRDKVQFNLADNTDGTPGYIRSCVAAFTNNEADLYNTHVYKFGYNAPNSDFIAWEKANIAECGGKTHFVGEFGFPGYDGSRQYGIDTYMRGVQLARVVLNFLNAGASGVSYWNLLDQYYNRHGSYGEMQQLGLWKYLKSAYISEPNVYKKIQTDYEVRPQYYAYSLLTRFIRQGDTVYPLSLGDEHIAGSAFLNREGKWTYVLVNATDKDMYVSLENDKSGADGTYDIYKYMEGRLPEGDAMIAPTEQTETKDHSIRLKLSRSSIRVLVQK